MTKHKVVALDNWVKPPPLDFDHEAVVYESSTLEQLPERMRDATIVLSASTRVDRAGIEAAPLLQLIQCGGTGTDQIDKDAVRDKGIALCHVPAQNTDSVSEHAFALYYAIRRRVVEMHQLVMDGTIWPRGPLISKLGRPPKTNAEETLVVIGYGALGRNVEKIGNALGMRVLIAERKGASDARQGRIPFDQAIKEGSVFVVVAPLDDTTRGMIGKAELDSMDTQALVINVGRGGIINEKDLAQALREGSIRGAATDVFEHEPATKENCPLLDPTIPNLVVSPHVAWYSSKTIKGTMATVKANLEGFAAGHPQNVVIDGKPRL